MPWTRTLAWTSGSAAAAANAAPSVPIHPGGSWQVPRTRTPRDRGRLRCRGRKWIGLRLLGAHRQGLRSLPSLTSGPTKAVGENVDPACDRDAGQCLVYVRFARKRAPGAGWVAEPRCLTIVHRARLGFDHCDEVLQVPGVELRRRGDDGRASPTIAMPATTNRIRRVLTQLPGDNVAGIGHLDRVTVRCRGGHTTPRVRPGLFENHDRLAELLVAVNSTTTTVVPAVSGTMIVMGRLGNSSAFATRDRPDRHEHRQKRQDAFHIFLRPFVVVNGRDRSVLHHDRTHRRSLHTDHVERERHQGHTAFADLIEIANIRHRNDAGARVPLRAFRIFVFVGSGGSVTKKSNPISDIRFYSTHQSVAATCRRPFLTHSGEPSYPLVGSQQETVARQDEVAHSRFEVRR